MSGKDPKRARRKSAWGIFAAPTGLFFLFFFFFFFFPFYFLLGLYFFLDEDSPDSGPKKRERFLCYVGF